MPTAPPVFRSRTQRSRAQTRREADRRRQRTISWRRWYNTPLWRRRRAEQLALQPWCERHLKRGDRVRATVANHKEPHRGDWDKFANGALESACDRCHNADIQREERAALRAGRGESNL